MGRRARARVVRDFSIEAEAANIATVYARVLQRDIERDVAAAGEPDLR
jgi:hypothetical protein